MSPAARALIEFLAEQVAAIELEQPPTPVTIDRDEERAENADKQEA